MIISRLEIHGFKSFADKISLDFQRGITAVVGPNGCGKSNIVDAIRWVMGEQSAKTLRGKSMEDTIFGGSEYRKPLGMTEVSLYFSTADGRIPAKYLNFSEIQVTRRLYRDGESEYLLNGTPCRLMDISELFMDTGAGAKAYSIIEQGKIGMILSSRPEERRLIIEEAAGVTKFKARKQVALKKIEATRQNLLRIGDIMAEIRRQMSSLQRQAKKAEKFREYREELKEIELQFAVTAYMALEGELKLAEADAASLHERLAGNSCEVGVCTVNLEEKRNVLLETEKTLAGIQEDCFRLRGEMSGIENRVSYEKKELAGLEERGARSSAELDSLRGRIAEAEDEKQRLRDQVEELKVAHAGEEEALSAAEGLLERMTEEERVMSRLQEERRSGLFGLLSEISHFNNQYGNAVKRKEALSGQVERNRREVMGISEKLHEACRRVTELETVHEGHAERSKALEQEQAALRTRETELLKSLEDVESRYQGARDRLSKASSRLHSLQELEAQFAGYGQGVRTLMLADGFKGRLQGVIADILEVDEENEVPLEAALAEKLQYVICDDEQDARTAISYLREQRGGRCGLIVRGLQLPSGNRAPQGAERLLDRLSVRPENLGMIQALLADTFLAENFDSALKLSRDYPHLTFVTPEGDLASSGGILHGGSLEAAQQGLIHKKRQIKELGLEVTSLTVQVKELESGRETLRGETAATGKSLKDCRQDLHQVEISLVNSEKDLQRAREECARLEERLALKAMEDRQLEEELESLETEMAKASSEKIDREAGREQAERELEEIRAAIGTKQREMEEAREIVTSRKVRAAAFREKQESALRALDRIEESSREFQARRAGLEADIEKGGLERRRIAASISAGEEQIRLLLERQRLAEISLAEIRSRYETESLLVQEGESRLKDLRDIADALSRNLGEKKLGITEISMKTGNLKETVAERYRRDMAELVPLYGGKDYDEVEKRARQAELSGLIDGIGEVNLTAIDDFREMEERFQFLSGQKSDLEESLHGLQQAIQRINRTTRKRFLDTFNLVNDKFQEVFPRLFCGGRAELKLTNEEDLLETGIDIVIQPPGKKLQNVNLLSGGEKALTAVALMFAIFLIKPAPFCLLDEVDAPLDEANIGRFNEMVREMSAFSQFIIITHSKATMATADSLYGVTMEEPGVSKLVSVKLH
ncbi:MAG: chromosome segregation protein SMC [Geobacteraceae bacterium]|nr:chromosome segregation protein SMC [Geobacteraceae bacterium]